MSYTYPAAGQPRPHAVTSTSDGGSFSYDGNGNMLSRRVKAGDPSYSQGWDHENRLSTVTVNSQTTTFTYDAGEALVKKVGGGVTTVYVGSHYEVQGGTVVKYYHFGGRRVGMRKGGVLYYLAGDHLGTTSLVICGQAGGCSGVPFGGKVAESRHYPYGGERWASGTLPTDYRFTGQRLESSLRLYHMGARWYDPDLGRWLSADTIVPNPANPQSLNRYAYVLGNPLAYIDPSGHREEGECGYYGEACQSRQPSSPPPVPPVITYLHQEMLSNALGKTTELLLRLNESKSGTGWAGLPTWAPGIGEAQSSAALADVASKAAASMIFGYMVRQGGPWDPKPVIGRRFGYSQEVGGDWYYYDIWGNIMFGYLGAAAGFSESELLNGAGVEQTGSSIGYSVQRRDLAFLPRRQPGVYGLAAWDDPVDQITSKAGISLWNAYGLNITPVTIIQAVTMRPGIPKKDKPWD